LTRPYPGGIALDTSFSFFASGAAIINTPGGMDEGDYFIEEERIFISYLSGEDSLEIILVIRNIAELADAGNSGNTYALEGAFDEGLAIGEYYYMDGDLDGGRLRFNNSSEFEFGDQLGDSERGSYTYDNGIVVIELGGEATWLFRINSYILESDWDLAFIRDP